MSTNGWNRHEFADAWNRCESVAAVADLLCLTVANTRYRVKTAREEGMTLKQMMRGRKPEGYSPAPAPMRKQLIPPDDRPDPFKRPTPTFTGTKPTVPIIRPSDFRELRNAVEHAITEIDDIAASLLMLSQRAARLKRALNERLSKAGGRMTG